jgi:hypothetical protein
MAFQILKFSAESDQDFYMTDNKGEIVEASCFKSSFSKVTKWKGSKLNFFLILNRGSKLKFETDYD